MRILRRRRWIPTIGRKPEEAASGKPSNETGKTGCARHGQHQRGATDDLLPAAPQGHDPLEEGIVPILSGAAGEPRHVLTEAQRGQFEPFDRGQIRKNGLAKRSRRHSVLEGKDKGLDAVCSLRSKDLASQQAIGFLIGNQLDAPACFASRERPRYLVEGNH